MFDQLRWPELLIIGGVLVLLFGSKKLPDAARGLGRSMRIFKSEVKSMSDDDASTTVTTTTATAPKAVDQAPTQAQAPIAPQTQPEQPQA